MKGNSSTILVITIGVIFLVLALAFFPPFLSKIITTAAEGSWTLFCGQVRAFCDAVPQAGFICAALGCRLPPVCKWDLSITSTSTTISCVVEATVRADYCKGKSWEVRNNSEVKCSGATGSDSYSYTCSWEIPFEETKTYNLYANEVKVDSKSAHCLPV